MDLVCLPFYIAKEKPLIDKTRFYAATFGKDYEHIIEKYEAGMEIDSFCQSVMLDDKDEIKRAGEIMRLSERHILHGPFTELYPAAIDPRARRLASDRLNQAYDVCRWLGINRMVVHSGYVPFVYFKEWHREHSIEFWQEFMSDKAEDFTVYIENVLDDEPYMMRELIEGIADKRIRLCIDTGHANAAGNVDICEWLEVLGEYTGHIHLHNNYGSADEHNPPDKGSMDMGKVLEYIDSCCGSDTTITIEAYDLESSFKWLAERGYI